MDAALRLCIAQAICTIHLDPKLRFNVVQVTQRLLNELFQTVKTDSRGSGTTLPGRFLQPTTMALSNASIIAFQADRGARHHSNYIARFRARFPTSTMTDSELIEVYKMAVSEFQSKDGVAHERFITEGVSNQGFGVYTQQHVDSRTGVFIKPDKKRVAHRKILDWVFGPEPVIGQAIDQHSVIGSGKITTRDRLDEDLWIQRLAVQPKLFVYMTLGIDYPEPDTFCEGPTRKMVCARVRDTDNRKFKLKFEDLVAEIQAALA